VPAAPGRPSWSPGRCRSTAPTSATTPGGNAWIIKAEQNSAADPVSAGAFASLSQTELAGCISAADFVAYAIDAQVTSTQGAATNNVGACGHFVWSSGAFTPTFTTSNASVRTLGGVLVLRPAAAAAGSLFKARPVINRAALIRAANI
jgi:hypothetical protein